ncbi:MAG TPA: contractile injection system tape measure protein [Parafilimonas sp.]
MSTQKHIIRQQTISIEMADNNSAVAIQDTVKHVYYDKILPKLDILFSEIVTNQTIVRIDKIEIDLGKIDKDKFELELVEKTISNIEKQLREKLQFDVSTSNSVNIVSAYQSAIDELIYFLEHGYFSWRSRYKNIVLLENALMAEGVSYNAFKKDLEKLISEKSLVVQRLIYQFSDNFLQFLAACFAPDFLSKDISLIIQKTLDKNAPVQSKVAVRNYFWRVVFANLSIAKNDLQLKVLSATIRFIASIQNSYVEDVLHSIGKTGLNIDVADQLKKIFEKEIDEEKLNTSKPSLKFDIDTGFDEINIEKNENYSSAFEENNTSLSDVNTNGADKVTKTSLNISDDVKTSSSLNANEPELLSKIKNAKTNIDENATNDTPNIDGPIYLDLAGLVILHNFLLPFFTELRLIENEKFLSDEALHKAIQLMGYLATGEICIEEPYLILPKLLCGMEMNAPVQKNIVITDDEKQECNALLKQVIEHWPALKNTSPDGLRNTFLKREGKLTRGGLGWQLDVEHKTWDILLARLPWGYSLIKLPWMKEFLFVNWS